MVTKSDFRRMLDELAAAWAARDYDRAAAYFAPDVRYGDPTRYAMNGRAELLAFFRNDEGYDQRTVWHTVVFDEEAQCGAAEYTYEGTHRYHGVVLVKMEGGLVARWREYQHIDDRDWDAFVRTTRF